MLLLFEMTNFVDALFSYLRFYINYSCNLETSDYNFIVCIYCIFLKIIKY